MQRLEVTGTVRQLYGSLGVKGLIRLQGLHAEKYECWLARHPMYCTAILVS